MGAAHAFGILRGSHPLTADQITFNRDRRVDSRFVERRRRVEVGGARRVFRRVKLGEGIDPWYGWTAAVCQRHIRAMALAVLLAAMVAAPWVEPIGDTGEENRLKIAIVGDGYTDSEQAKLTADARAAMSEWSETEPFTRYVPLFSVRLVHLVSAVSGAGTGAPLDTALGAFINCLGIDGVLCYRLTYALDAASAAFPIPDLIVVLVNDPRYAGAASAVGSPAIPGPVPLAAITTGAIAAITHEIGHALGNLADEYVLRTAPNSCDPVVDCPEANATMETSRERIKWRAWIEPSTPIPTPSGHGFSGVGLFEGARWQLRGVFRPVDVQCKMNDSAQGFCPVCREQLVRSTWSLVSLIQATSPATGSTVVDGCLSASFEVSQAPVLRALQFQWALDGSDLPCQGPEVTFDAGALSSGAHTLSVTAHEDSEWVRSDPAGALTRTAQWSLTVNACASDVASAGAGTRCAEPSAKPVAVLSAPASVTSGATATLEATRSFDPGARYLLSYEWAQLEGPSASLAPDGGAARFVAPAVQIPTTVSFSLTVYDGAQRSEPVVVHVKVLPSTTSGCGTTGGATNATSACVALVVSALWLRRSRPHLRWR